jgi:hypothetical protein
VQNRWRATIQTQPSVALKDIARYMCNETKMANKFQHLIIEEVYRMLVELE